jgi:hypothetical protein
MPVPYTFQLSTLPIPLANLDANFTYFTTAISVSGTNVTLTGQLTLTNASDYNLYASGAGKNFMQGALGIGAVPTTQANLYLANNITGASTSYGVQQASTIQSDVANAFGYNSLANTAAASFTLTQFTHFRAQQGTFGVGSAVTSQYGFNAASNLTGATNNYGFWGNIPVGTGRFNFYAAGTADNYFAGNVGIGGIVPTTYLTLNAAGQVEGIAGVAGSTYLWGLTRNNVNGVAIDSYGSTTFVTNSLTGSKTGTERGSVSGAGVWSLGAAVGSESLRVTPVASAVNRVEITGNTTGNGVNIYSRGSDANVGMYYVVQGAAFHTFITNWPSNAVQFNVAHTASAVNYLQVTGGATGNGPTLSAQGSDANIGMFFYNKGTGGFRFTNGSQQNYFAVGSNGLTAPANYLQVDPAATGGAPSLTVQGSDTNAALNLASKGLSNIVLVSNGVIAATALNLSSAAVNYISLRGNTTGNAPSIVATGSDANIDFYLQTTGTGVLQFGTYTAGIVAQAGYITIKDAAGNTRRLLVG